MCLNEMLICNCMTLRGFQEEVAVQKAVLTMEEEVMYDVYYEDYCEYKCQEDHRKTCRPCMDFAANLYARLQEAIDYGEAEGGFDDNEKGNDFAFQLFLQQPTETLTDSDSSTENAPDDGDTLSQAALDKSAAEERWAGSKVIAGLLAGMEIFNLEMGNIGMGNDSANFDSEVYSPIAPDDDEAESELEAELCDDEATLFVTPHPIFEDNDWRGIEGGGGDPGSDFYMPIDLMEWV